MYQSFVVVPILLFITPAFGVSSSPNDDDGLTTCSEDLRTVLSIIWSCLATIFACTWLAVHPNVPGRNITTNGAITCAIERAKIIAITILAPEVILAWAAEQFIVAWKLRHGKYTSIASAIDPWREQKDDSKLTLAHCFFLSMGGFYYTRKYEIPHQVLDSHKATSTPPPSSLLHTCSSNPTTSLNPRFLPDDTPGSETVDVPGTLVTLKALESDPDLVKKLAAISAETIEDKSKGDALSKTFSILQISWFIVQCIARVIQHLPITLLEMTALAFAGLSIIMYFLWWYKPLNVKYHISLDGSDSRPMPDKNNPEESASPVKSSRHRLDWFREWIGFTTFEGPEDRYYEDIGDGAFRFYSGTEEQQPRRFMTMVVVGSLFGVFHCAAWSFHFPSHAEMVLWRLSSITVVIGLFLAGHLAGILIIMEWVDPEWTSKPVSVFLRAWRDDKTWPFILTCILGFMTIVAIVSYIVARIMLIILAFLQLRSLPLSTFCAVQWTTYIPHV
ncbi:hypothetical protein ARMSODRAFT_946153 [Armillaria solidipes]|uniref:Uncharacterized protein n=1 Tax=Armillaria solidipes TaxID=1076256 RepID=A0A2H3B6V0_9AGAR|nr:hypothetical protein ARMSODRAFT_946153 [Armillaria solidipes]